MYPDSSYRHSIRQFLTFVICSRNAYKYVHYLTLYHFHECITNLLGVLRLLKKTLCHVCDSCACRSAGHRVLAFSQQARDQPAPQAHFSLSPILIPPFPQPPQTKLLTKWRCLGVRRSFCLLIVIVLSSTVASSHREHQCQGICPPESISNNIEISVLIHD